MYIVEYNLPTNKYNPTKVVWGSINAYLKFPISKKQRGKNLSETRLSEAVSTNLMYSTTWFTERHF